MKFATTCLHFVLVTFAFVGKQILTVNGQSLQHILSPLPKVPGGRDGTPPPSLIDATFLPPDWNDDAKVDIPGLGEVIGGSNLTLPLLPNGKKFHWYAGIPYSDPASYTKENRFKKKTLTLTILQPSEIWPDGKKLNSTGAFQATNYAIKCPQSGASSFEDFWNLESRPTKASTEEMSEECLVLNINTRFSVSGESKKLVPVIVFVHGGSFDSSWSGLYRGHRFLNKDVVFVSVNYRLGLLGSLNLGIDEAPGNAALYDIITALKWIKRRIEYFGGDKNRVIVAGHSAGGVLATHLLTSDLAIDEDDNKPLLHGIIGLSGSSLSQTLAFTTTPLSHHLQASRFAGCVNGTDANPNVQAIRNCMANKSVQELLEALSTYRSAEKKEGRFGLEASIPSLQDRTKLAKVKPIITDTPYSVLSQGTQKLNIPVMMGATRHDGSYLVEQSLEQYWRPNNFVNDPLFLRNQLLPTLLDVLGLEDASGELLHSLASIYLGDALHTDDFESKIPGLIDIYSVLAFKAGAYNLVELHARKNSTYYFSFEYSSFLCSMDNGQAIPGGVGHMMPLFYLFPSNLCSMILPKDLSIANEFIDYWINFATHGNPNGSGKKRMAAPYNPINHAYLKIDRLTQTSYYCRDSWVNNSLELVKTPSDPSSMPPEPSTTTNRNSSTSPDPFTSEPTTSESENDPNASCKVSNTIIVLIFTLLCTFIYI